MRLKLTFTFLKGLSNPDHLHFHYWNIVHTITLLPFCCFFVHLKLVNWGDRLILVDEIATNGCSNYHTYSVIQNLSNFFDISYTYFPRIFFPLCFNSVSFHSFQTIGSLFYDIREESMECFSIVQSVTRKVTCCKNIDCKHVIHFK